MDPSAASVDGSSPAAGTDAPVKPWFRRSRFAVPAMVAASVSVAVGLSRCDDDPNRRLGPEATVVGNECEMGEPPASVIALDGDSGKVRWSRLVGVKNGRTPGAWSSPTGLAVADGTLVVSTDAGVIQGLRAANGAYRWCAEGSVVSAVDDRLFTGHRGTVVEIDPTTGGTESVTPDLLPSLLGAAADPIAVRGNDTGMDLRQRKLTATNRATGEELWTRDVPGHQFVTTTDFVLVNDQTNGTSTFPGPGEWPGHFTVTAYRLDSGDETWSVQVPEFAALFLAGDRVYLKGWTDGTLRAIDPATGRVFWAVEVDHPGRTARFSEPGELTAVTVDPETGDVLVLLVSDPPYRD